MARYGDVQWGDRARHTSRAPFRLNNMPRWSCNGEWSSTGIEENCQRLDLLDECIGQRDPFWPFEFAARTASTVQVTHQRDISFRLAHDDSFSSHCSSQAALFSRIKGRPKTGALCFPPLDALHSTRTTKSAETISDFSVNKSLRS